MDLDLLTEQEVSPWLCLKRPGPDSIAAPARASVVKGGAGYRADKAAIMSLG